MTLGRRARRGAQEVAVPPDLLTSRSSPCCTPGRRPDGSGPTARGRGGGLGRLGCGEAAALGAAVAASALGRKTREDGVGAGAGGAGHGPEFAGMFG